MYHDFTNMNWKKNTGQYQAPVSTTTTTTTTKPMGKEMCNFLLKLILVGDSNVGKTSLMMRFSEDKCIETHVATVGIDFRIKTFRMDGALVKLQIWDTAGQERFRCIIPSYFRSVDGVILVYDITDYKSYSHIRDWIRTARAHASIETNFILVGNKCDLEEKRCVNEDAGKNLAEEYHFEFLEASGKLNINVQQVFAHLSRTIIRRKTQDPHFDCSYDAPELAAERKKFQDLAAADQGRCCS